MVRLTRIYTKGGDKGETSLGSGARVAKRTQCPRATHDVPAQC
jgi:cob(I)alamin adenosyltransferase